jgi:RND family efflux transporter MFP subunit
MSLSKKVLGTSLLLMMFISACGETTQQAGRKAIPVKLQTLTTNTLVESSEFVGTLIASQNVDLAPKIQGRILQIYAQFGQTVKKGDPIILLEPTQQQEQVNSDVGNLNAQKATLARTEAELRTAEAERDAAKAVVAQNLANVARSAADLANAQETLKTRQANLRRSQAQLEFADIELKRFKFLVAEDVRPQQDLDDRVRQQKSAKETVEADAQTVAAAKATVQARLGSLNAEKAALKQAQESLRAAEARIIAAKADVNRQKGEIDRAAGQVGVSTQSLVFNRVLAPIDGVVGDIVPKVGDFLSVGDKFTNIADNSVMEMDINVPTERADDLQLGLPVEILLDGGKKSQVVGEIGFISPTVDQEAQAILTKVFFRNDGSLRNRQYVRVRLIWKKQPGILIPTDAVKSLGSEKFVFVAQPGESQDGQSTLLARQTKIQVGKIQGQSYQVRSGVNVNDRIAVTQIINLNDNTPIVEQEEEKEAKPQQ